MDEMVAPTFPPHLVEAIAACDAERVRREAERKAKRAARTFEQRRFDFVVCGHCDGAGGFSDWNTRGPDCREWDCKECDGSGEHEERAAAWDRAVAMWNATPGGEDGEARCEAMTAAFGNDDTLWQEMDAMFTELGVVK